MKFGTDGVRGVANTELTASFALAFGRAAARVLGTARAVIGGDTRQSTPMLEAAVTAGLATEGVEVHRLGVVPTPAVAHAAAHHHAIGVMVSASHNPFSDNGLKLFAPGGLKLTDAMQHDIEAELDALPAPSGMGGTVVDELDTSPYAEHLLDALGGRRLDGITVVIDTANGAAHELAPDVFTAAGASVIPLHTQPDGTNINAHCGATQPQSLIAAVAAQRADVGLALDGDADRLIAVDHRGRLVDGDHVIAICARDLHDRGQLHDDAVVVTVMTNLGFRLAMRDAGIDVIETDVGDRYVLEMLERRQLSLGGEQSGHVIFRDRATTGDGLLTGLMLCDVVGRTGKSLADLAEGAMTALPQVLVNVPVVERRSDWVTRLADDILAAEQELGEDGRVLVRPSGTEPLVRVMVEAPTVEAATTTAEHLAAAIREHASTAG